MTCACKIDCSVSNTPKMASTGTSEYSITLSNPMNTPETMDWEKRLAKEWPLFVDSDFDYHAKILKNFINQEISLAISSHNKELVDKVEELVADCHRKGSDGLTTEITINIANQFLNLIKDFK